MKKLLKSIVKTAAFAAAILPYRVEKDGEELSVKSILYNVERHIDRSDAENEKEEYTVTLLPMLQDQIELVRDLFSDCKEKWNDPDDEKVRMVREKLALAKEKLEKVKPHVTKEGIYFGDEAPVDEADFPEEEFTAGFEAEEPAEAPAEEPASDCPAEEE